MERVSSEFQWIQIPELRDPYLVVGFYGWSNAGSVSSDTLHYMTDQLQTRLIATLSDEGFINYTVDRPVARIEEGLIQHMESMCAELTCWRNPAGERDLLFMLGKEPHFNWLTYAGIILGAMKTLGAKRLYTVGGVQDTISHSAPAVVSIVGSSPYLTAGTAQLDPGIRPAEYQGPVSIHSCLVKICTEAGTDAVSLWGHVPAYVQKSPRLVSTLITILNKALGMDCPVDVLKQKSIELDRKIDEALAKDPSLKQFVESLESRDQPPSPSPGDEKVIRLNQFLRRDPKKDPEL